MKIFISFFIVLLLSLNASSSTKADKVIVEKSQAKLLLMYQGKVINEYHVAFGAEPKGHKKQEGDERTPEGEYVLDYKKSNSSFYKAIHISYPNEQDKLNAKKLGVNPGGMIMIHGQKNGFGLFSFITQKFNWTNGCIAVTNLEMDEIWDAVDENTPIEIRP